jgi:hypothetical protein
MNPNKTASGKPLHPTMEAPIENQKACIRATGEQRFAGDLLYEAIIPRGIEDVISEMCDDTQCNRHLGLLRLLDLGAVAYRERRKLLDAQLCAAAALANWLMPTNNSD